MRTTIALGSNLGDRLLNLQMARDLLHAIASPHSFTQSAVYRTSPVACAEDAPDFYNAVVAFDFEGTASELHQATQKVENQLGRLRSTINAPRTIDIDILTFGNVTSHEVALQIPHPRMLERLFVLKPLCDIDPTLQLPQDPHTAFQHLNLLPNHPPLIRVQTIW